MNKNTVWMIAKYGLGIGLLAWVIASHWRLESDGQEVGLAAALERQIHVGPLLLAGLICTLSVLLTFVRWFVLVRAQGLPFTMGDAFRLGLVGSFFNTCLPGSVGGDLIKAAFLAREQSRRTVAVATVMIDRIIGLCGLFWLAALVGGALWWSGRFARLSTSQEGQDILRTLLVLFLGLSAGSLIFWLALGLVSSQIGQRWALALEKIPKVGSVLAEVWRSVLLYRRRGASVGLGLVLAMVGHVGFVLTFYFSALTLTAADLVPSLEAHFLLVPAGMTFQAGVPTPAGVGGGELGFGTLYQWVGAVFAVGVLGSLVQRLWLSLIGFVGYLVYLRLRPSLPEIQAPG